ncbi:hypothetical protein FOZ63_010421 [Perkinsus olseni]|uniref:Aminotransferase class I/classII large domain-containing protein n=1 Tax=Perkinsus olseni TaxID=32597 RepID=A0A7J6TXN1_PEROL|nr:hypothetical protein FOZ63_010421 [Perkinsus olseni]
MSAASELHRVVPKSLVAARTTNPIRRIVDQLKVKPNPNLETIPLSIGDPTVYGNFRAPQHVIDNVLRDNLRSFAYNGYPHSCGYAAARQAVADENFVHPNHPPPTTDDVVMTCGASQAIDMAIAALANPNGEDTILLPQPAFPLYNTLCSSRGINVDFYKLRSDRKFEVDITSLQHCLEANGSKARGVLLNNPSNPCGSNWTREHIQDIVALCEEYGDIPIIADEIYHDMVISGMLSSPLFSVPFQSFDGLPVTPFASVSDTVPILSIGGIAKRTAHLTLLCRFMVPGWRVGWICLHDRGEVLGDIRQGLHDLSTLTLGPASLLQSAVPSLLKETPASYHNNNKKMLLENSRMIMDTLMDVPGLNIVEPQAAMYVMVGIDTGIIDVEDDINFSRWVCAVDKFSTVQSE